MSTIVTRSGKGSPLSHVEVDANFTNLNTDKIQSGNTVAALTITSATINGGTINGTVGATTPAAGTFTSITDSGNLTFTGTGNRITGDFSNGTLANRVFFQTSTTNGNSSLQVMPNGTATFSGFNFLNSSDTSNYGGIQIRTNSTEIGLSGFALGTGTQLPMTFAVGGSERLRIDTSGNVGIGTSSPTTRFNVGTAYATGFNSTVAQITGTSVAQANGVGMVSISSNDTMAADKGGSLNFGSFDSGISSPYPCSVISGRRETATAGNYSGYFAIATATSNGTLSERMRIGSAGQIGIGGANYGTSGQVLTSGGSGAAPSWATPSGGTGISQVVQTVKTDAFTMASTTYADITGLSVTITPSSSSSKILVMANVNHVGTTLTSASGIRLMRDSTAIGIGDAAGSRIRTSGGESYGNFGVTLTGDAIMFLDSPATTSATTYKIQIRVYGSTAYVNRSPVDSDDQAYYRSMSSITVMEVK